MSQIEASLETSHRMPPIAVGAHPVVAPGYSPRCYSFGTAR